MQNVQLVQSQLTKSIIDFHISINHSGPGGVLNA